MTPIGGDHLNSAGAKETPIGVLEGTAAGGAVGLALGAVTTPLTGPVGPIVGGLVGAHVGSLYSFHKMKESGEHERGEENLIEPRKPGMLLAVAVDDPAQEAHALKLLRDLDAHHIERASGSIVDGDWVDFDPLSAPDIIP
jgi:phage tail tape-measure protein